MKPIYQFRKRAIAVAVTTLIVNGISGVAHAQDTELEEVVVTGSRIQRADLSSVSPVSIIGAEEFTISGNLFTMFSIFWYVCYLFLRTPKMNSLVIII